MAKKIIGQVPYCNVEDGQQNECTYLYGHSSEHSWFKAEMLPKSKKNLDVVGTTGGKASVETMEAVAKQANQTFNNRQGMSLQSVTADDQMYPIHDRIVVKRIEAEEFSKGGLKIPEAAKEKPIEGEVMWVGKGKVLESGIRVAMEVKPGDRVLFGKYSGIEVKLNDQDYVIMREADVLVILKKRIVQ